MRASAAVVIGGVLGLWGCSQSEVDPLDHDVVADLGSQQGDASGLDASGRYLVVFEEERCDCDVGGIQALASLCRAIRRPSLLTQGTEMNVVQAEGQVSLLPEEAQFQTSVELQIRELVGPLNADGTFSAGFVSDFVSLSRGRVLLRADGDFEDLDTTTPTISGTLAYRIQGDILLQIEDGRSNWQPIDCTDELIFEGPRVSQ